ncbi:MAG: ATP synthase subunit I [Pseudohongiellaceae bacterium]
MIGKLSVVKIVALQTGLAAAMTAATGLFLGWVEAKSVAIGALIAIIPGAYFGYMFFRETGSRTMKRTIRRAYIAEVVKLVMIGAGFALTFRFVSAFNPLALFCGFALAHGFGIYAIAKAQSAFRQGPGHTG